MSRLTERRSFKLVFFSALSLLLVELAFRVVAMFLVGPTALLYGTPLERGLERKETWDELAHRDEPEKIQVEGKGGSYGRFPPHLEKSMPLPGGGTLNIGINNHGFRGADFALEKAPGVRRVITLGASSTFGFFVPDNDTYPAFLERILNRSLEQEPIQGVERFEVLNFGIPHLHSDEIRALFVSEGLAASPDYVTFYEGINDTRRLERRATERTFIAAARHLLVLRFVMEQLWNRYETFNADDLDYHLRGKREFFLEQIAGIRDACQQRGVKFFAVTQQAASLSIPRTDLAGVSYREEERRIRAKLAEGRVVGYEMAFLLHTDLMRALREWAGREDVEVVDVIDAFDRAGRRDCLLTWVHMSPEGNRIIALELATAILRAARG